MLGAIVGDIAGSMYEWRNCKSERDIQIFRSGSKITDDTILTLATAKHVLSLSSDNNKKKQQEKKEKLCKKSIFIVQWLKI